MSAMTNEQPATPPMAGAVIEIRRRRRIAEIMAIGWRVFIDEVWVGDIKQGRAVRFNVAAGPHTLKIWSHKGAYCSDEMAVDVVPGSVRAFECRSRPMALGVSRIHDQVDVITNTMKDGGVTQGQILLEEIPQPSAHTEQD
jgi:hypothetical protein